MLTQGEQLGESMMHDPSGKASREKLIWTLSRVPRHDLKVEILLEMR